MIADTVCFVLSIAWVPSSGRQHEMLPLQLLTMSLIMLGRLF